MVARLKELEVENLRLKKMYAEVQEYATRWLWHYNNERPNMVLSEVTSKQKLFIAA